MAANNQIVKKSIQIDAGDTLRTVKSLKQEIADLRDELLNLEKGTEEYDEVQKQLTDDVNDLNEVMGAHKEKAQALEGSYNDLQNQLKELKTAWKETNDEAERDVLGQKINELNSQLKEMDASIGDFHRNVGNYQSAWDGLSGTMEKNEKIVDDLEKGIKAFGTAMGLSDKQVNAISKSLKSLKDGFKIAKDIAKAKEETIKLGEAEKTTAAEGTALATSQKATGAAAKTMAVSEGTATMATKGLSVAMRGLKAAIISTGIGVLIVALGELINMLDNVRIKIRNARNESLNSAKAMAEFNNDYYERLVKGLDEWEDATEHALDMMEARGEAERDILVKRKEEIDKMILGWNDWIESAQKDLDDFNEHVEGLSKRRQRRNEEEIKATREALEKNLKLVNDTVNNLKEKSRDAGWAIEIFDEQAKHAKATTEELKKWAELIQDQKFRTAWKSLFQVEYEGNSPTEVLKAQRNAAIALVQSFKGDTSEVERFFEQMIDEAEAEWQSLVDKEKEIFDERLTPAQRLENEKQEWITKANAWGMDAVEIVRYYDKKIQEELDRADEERKAKEDAANEERLAKLKEQTEEQLSLMESALSTQEKMHELFNPMFMTDTAAGDIQQEIDNIQLLYDTQMEYLNGLLESADLTEEAYEGIEQKILELTVAFNSQMDVLKAEQDFQGKNWAILSRKAVANFQLMEDAASNFSQVFQSLGLENSVAYKGFASAQAIISAILAANRVLAEEPGGAVIKGIAAAATLAAGLANVAAIWAVNPDGSNAGSAMNTSMEQSATPVIGNSQPINYTRNITTAAEQDEMNAPIYVTVTDIEDGINGRRAQVANSSF